MKRDRHSFFGLLFVLVIAGVAIWYLISASYELYHYLQFSQQTVAQVKGQRVQEVKGDCFVIMVDYMFEYEGKKFNGKAQVGPCYPNPWAAEHGQKRFSATSMEVWFNPKYPGQSVLEKHFPLKKTLSASVLILVTLYFLILGVYMKKNSS